MSGHIWEKVVILNFPMYSFTRLLVIGDFDHTLGHDFFVVVLEDDHLKTDES